MEFIRRKTMDRLAIVGPSCEKWINECSPSCNEIFQINKRLVVRCVVLFNGDTIYEISDGDDTYPYNLLVCKCLHMYSMRSYWNPLPTCHMCLGS